MVSHLRQAFFVGVIGVALSLPAILWAATQNHRMAPGEVVTVRCETHLVGRIEGRETTLSCGPLSTLEPVASAMSQQVFVPLASRG